MTILDLRDPSRGNGRSKRSARVWVGIALIAAVLGVGSTIAANITINGGNTAEFGQGAQRTIYCGSGHEEGVKIALTPFSKYEPSFSTQNVSLVSRENETSDHADKSTANTTPGTFYLGGVTVSNIPKECSGVNFVITIYDTNGQAINLYKSEGNVTSPTVWFVNGCSAIIEECPDSIKPGGHGAVLSGQRTTYAPLAPNIVGVTSTNDAFTITFNTEFNGDKIKTETISDITIETQNDTFGLDEFKAGTPSVVSKIQTL